MLEIGMEVEVSSQFINGLGTIIDISNAAYYPVQVEMDNPDIDGHKIFRFYPTEVRKQTNKFIAIKEHKVELIKPMTGYSLKLGECFTARSSKTNKGTHYLIYSRDKLRGCFPISCFRTVASTDIVQPAKGLEPEKQMKEQAFTQQEHQTSIFEFI